MPQVELDRSYDNTSKSSSVKRYNSVSPRKFIFRSNSEIYLKDTDMQDEEDLVMPQPFRLPLATPILYAEATASENTIPLTIDQTQMNNLMRNIHNQDFSTIYVNTAIQQ